MEFVLEVILENFGYLLLSVLIPLCTFLGRTRTAEELKNLRDKKIAKLQKKCSKEAEQLKKDCSKLDELNKED